MGRIMKLIFCKSCEDVLKLMEYRKVCDCGSSWGEYIDDSLINAVYGGKAVPIGFNNRSFVEALRPMSIKDSVEFVAFVIPKKCDSFRAEKGEGVVRRWPSGHYRFEDGK